MQKFLLLFALAFVLTTVESANGIDSLLRITCEGESVGAEVQLNRQFRCESPLDIAVQEGEQKLRVVKMVDVTHERVFEQTVRMGDEVVKRLEELCRLHS